MIRVNDTLCVGCGKCEDVCNFEAVTVQNGKAVIGESCAACRQCIKNCPVNAISEDTVETDLTIDVSAFSDVWSIAEFGEDGKTPCKVSYELVCKGRELSEVLGQRNVVVCLCESIDEETRNSFASCGCDELILIKNPAFALYDTDRFSKTLTELIEQYKPAVVLVPASENGRDLPPRISAALRVGLTADCTGLEIDDEMKLVQIRPTYGGNIMASILSPNTRPQMASIRPNTFQVKPADKPSQMQVTEIMGGTVAESRVQRVGVRKKDQVFRDVSEAEFILGGGYGLGKEGFLLLQELADLTNAAIGATRKPVDLGWVPYDIQIGQTGKTVAPKLYINFGVSGALQHSIGIKNAKKIISVNNDPVAPIFTQSNVAILGDAKAIIEELIKLVKEQGPQALMNWNG